MLSINRAPGPKPGVLPTAPLPDVVLFIQSERSDLNRRFPVPRTGAITRLRYVLMTCKQPVWELNPSLRLERAVSCSDRRTGHVVSLCARTFHAVDWEALESSSPGLQPGARPSQLPVRLVVLDESTKKARCRDDTGLCVIRKTTAECHKRNGCDGSKFACS